MIDGDSTFALAAALLACVAAGFWAERQPWGQKVGGPLIVLFLGMALSNLGLIPHSSPLYGQIAGLLVPLAIPLLMLRADLRRVLRDAGPLLLVFCLAASFTLVGGLVAAQLVDLGPDGPEIAGTLVASYIGGSLNFVATASAVGLDDPSLYTSAMSADAVGAVFFLLALMSLPAFALARRAMPSRYPLDGVAETGGEGERGGGEAFRLDRIASGLALSFLICAIAGLLASWVAMDSLFILAVTLLSLLVANTGGRLVAHVQYDFEIGTLLMYVFFASIGAAADIALVLGTAMPLLGFILLVVLVHLALMLVAGRLLRLDLAEVMIASNACILGPAPAAALAASRGWRALVTPGMLVGLFGYSIATFLGVSLTSVLGALAGQ